MVNIIKDFVSSSLAKKVSYSTPNKKNYIVIHETANTSKGADARAHAKLQKNGNPREASWHFQTDSKEIIQSFDTSVSCWAAGTKGNYEGIHIEICVNSDGDFKKAVANAAELVKHLMKTENISIQNVKQHNYFTGKNCPTNLRNGSKGINWAQFIEQVKGAPTPAQKAPSIPKDASMIQVKVDKLNYYNAPQWTNPAGTVNKGTKLTVKKKHKVDAGYQYELISGTFITASEDYVEVITGAKAAQAAKPKPKEDRVQITAHLLNYYNSPRWTKPSGTVKKGEVFTVIGKVKTDGAYQYKLKSGTYISANEKHSKLI